MTDELKSRIRTIPDFPRQGILFRDITTLLRDGEGLRAAVDGMVENCRERGVARILAVESRGFILGGALAYALGAGLVLVRKAGKLPAAAFRETYDLEYGQDSLEMHADAVEPGDRVLVVDDLLATGGTAEATVRLARRGGAEVVGCGFLIELEALGGRARLGGLPVFSLIRY